MNFCPKSKDMTRKNFPTSVGNNFPLYHWVEFNQTRGYNPLQKVISSARKGYTMKTKVKASEWADTLSVFVENAIESGMVALELSGVIESMDKKQITVIKDNESISDKNIDSVKDELYDKAVNIIKTEGKASTSFLQRKLQIGYNRAARIMEIMEKEGVVGQANHVGKREIL